MARRRSEGVKMWAVQVNCFPDGGGWEFSSLPHYQVAIYEDFESADMERARRTVGDDHRVIPVTVTPIAAKKKRLSSGTLKNKDGTPFKLPKTWGKMRKVKKNAK